MIWKLQPLDLSRAGVHSLLVVVVVLHLVWLCGSTVERRPWYTGPKPTLTPQNCAVPDEPRPPINLKLQTKEFKYTSLLDMKPPKYLNSFKNPCWYECMEYKNPYRGGHFTYYIFDDFNVTFDYMNTQVYPERFKSGQGWRLRCLPSFFLIGAPKCGTTDLFYYLTAHPNIHGPPMKEPQWWALSRTIVPKQRPYYSEIESFSSYVDIFDLAAESVRQHYVNKTKWHYRIIGDGSVGTYFNNDRWRQYEENKDPLEPTYLTQHFMHHVLPDAKLMVILRNPTDRLYSSFYFYPRNPSESNPETFHNLVVEALAKMKICIARTSLRHCAYDVDLYKSSSKIRLRVGLDHVFLKDWFSVYDRKQMLVMKFEDYKADPFKTLSDAFEFLDVDPVSIEWYQEQSEFKKVINQRQPQQAEKGPMMDKTRKLLDEFYEPHKKELAKLLKDDRFLWK